MAGLGFDIVARARCGGSSRRRSRRSSTPFRDRAALDHVNAHKHFHLHPTIARMIVAIGRDHGMRGLRVPVEPIAVLAQVDPQVTARRGMTAPWARLLARAARRAGLQTPDAVFGLAWSGAMTPPARWPARAPAGGRPRSICIRRRATISRTRAWIPLHDELAALTSSAAISAARQPGIALGGYADLAERALRLDGSNYPGHGTVPLRDGAQWERAHQRAPHERNNKLWRELKSPLPLRERANVHPIHDQSGEGLWPIDSLVNPLTQFMPCRPLALPSSARERAQQQRPPI